LVSIIIPTYNRALFLKRAIDSVYSQSFRDFEVIVVDDGSTDETVKLAGKYDSRLRYMYISHSGVSKARNTGITNAKGKWISLLDSDDYWLSKKLEKQVDYLKKNKIYTVCHTDEIWIRNGKRINQGKRHKKYEGWFFYPSLELCLISPSSIMIHRDILSEVGLFDESMPWVEDYDLWLRITSKFPIGYIDEKLVVKTGGHDDQLSKKIDGIERYRILALEKLIKSKTLSPSFLEKAIEVYLKKCNIYISGCLKRGKLKEVEELSHKMSMINLNYGVSVNY